MTTHAMLVLAALFMAADMRAQTGIGFGALKRAFNMTELAGTLADTTVDEDIKGLVHINGLLYVSGANRNAGPGSPKKVYIVDPVTTTLLGHFDVPEPHQSSNIGAYDLATDLAGNILAAGVEGVACFDTAGNQVATIEGNNGPVPLPLDAQGDPVVANQGGGLDLMAEHPFANRRYSGLAFDPAGDGNNGSLIVGDGANPAPFLELRISGAEVLRVFNDGGAGDIDSFGLVFDPLRGTLWTNSTGDFTTPITAGLYEIDYQNAVDLGGGNWSFEPTGRFIPLMPPQPGMRQSRFGALDILAGGDPGSPWGATFDLVAQSNQRRIDNGRQDDFIGFHRLHQIPGVPGDEESFLSVAKSNSDGSGLTSYQPTDAMLVQPGNRLFFKMNANGRNNLGAPVPLILLNLPASAGLTALTPLAPLGLPGNFPELISPSPFSSPPDQASTALLSGASIGPVVQITSDAGLPAVFSTGDRIRSQFIYFDASADIGNGIQLAASNRAGFLVVGINSIEFKMDAPSAFSADLLDPFIQLREFGNGDATTSITRLIISTKNGRVEGATDPLGATGSILPPGAYFDIGQGMMADRFAAGNAFGDVLQAIVSGCNGTYRPIDPGGNPFTSVALRSDLDVGLIYGDGLLDPSVNTPYNLGRGDPEDLDGNGPTLPPIDATPVPPYHADAATLTEYGRGYGGCFFEFWPDVMPYTDGAGNPGTAYPYQSGFVASDGQFGVDSAGVEQPGYNATDPDPPGKWLWQPQTLEFNFTPGQFLGKTFGFDLDVDGTGSIGDAGGALAGLYVEVHLDNGAVFSGLTLPDGTDPDVSLIGW